VPSTTRRWYIVHTFAGHEQKVIGALRNIIKSRSSRPDLRDLPARRGRDRVQVRQKGHRLQAHVPELPADPLRAGPEIFYVIGSTPGVTGFVGAEKTRPTALTRREVDNIIHPFVEGVEVAPTSAACQPTNSKSRHGADKNRSLRHVLGPRGRDQRGPAEGQGARGHIRTRDPVELDFTQVTKL